ncbi:glycoside hydrolase family 32 protein [Paenibacillus kandeliae]|uniref:glycoside hydrolase family 32 protein n=1 Tax=Paenibacillus kandeliae TaxID=3231269 RepID=UPI00345980B8
MDSKQVVTFDCNRISDGSMITDSGSETKPNSMLNKYHYSNGIRRLGALLFAACLYSWLSSTVQAAEVSQSGESSMTNHPSVLAAAIAAEGETATWNHNGSHEYTVGDAVWALDRRGMRGVVLEGGQGGMKLYAQPTGTNLVLMTDLMPVDEQLPTQTQAPMEAGLVLRTDEQGQQGYQVLLIRNDHRITARLQQSDGTIIQQSQQSYPSESGAKHRLELHVQDHHLQLYVDGYAQPALDTEQLTDGADEDMAGIVVVSGAASFQDTYRMTQQQFYGEDYRPAYHYSALRGWASDPNGLIYYKGEYHLFHQDGGRWAHAVSTDLLHWKNLPFALEWNQLGHIWSGSTIADEHNVSGLFDGTTEGGLIAYYTSYTPTEHNGNQKIGIAYSTDRGRTWRYPTDRPVVIDNPGKRATELGGWDFRDPKIVRDDAHNRWVMVVSGGDHVRLFVSTNLLDWTLTDNFGYGNYIRGGVWECPDLFPLQAADGTVKWVLMISTGANPNTEGSDAEYFIGQLDSAGKFINDNPAGTVLKTDWGKEFYASMSFAGLPQHQRIVMAWMTNWDYAFEQPTGDWKGVLTIPRQLSLVSTPNGWRLSQQPVEQLNTLRTPLLQTQAITLQPDSPDLLAGLSSASYEIQAEIRLPQQQPASSFGFRLLENGDSTQFTEIGYMAADQQLFIDRAQSGITNFSPLFRTRQQATLPATDGIIRLRILVDRSTVEVFANNGQTVFSSIVFPDATSRQMSLYTTGGHMQIVSLKVHRLSNVWDSQRP